MPAIAAFAIQILTALPSLIKAGIDITTLVSDSTAKLEKMQAEKRDPTPEEWADLNSRIKALRDELHAPGGQP